VGALGNEQAELEVFRTGGRAERGLEPQLQQLYAEKPKIIEATRRFFKRLGEAPIVVCAYFEPANREDVTSFQNVAAAIQNLLLVAHAEGLGTCWMTGPVTVANEISRFI
jgi:nitroreductase